MWEGVMIGGGGMEGWGPGGERHAMGEECCMLHDARGRVGVGETESIVQGARIRDDGRSVERTSNKTRYTLERIEKGRSVGGYNAVRVC